MLPAPCSGTALQLHHWPPVNGNHQLRMSPPKRYFAGRERSSSVHPSSSYSSYFITFFAKSAGCWNTMSKWVHFAESLRPIWLRPSTSAALPYNSQASKGFFRAFPMPNWLKAASLTTYTPCTTSIWNGATLFQHPFWGQAM